MKRFRAKVSNYGFRNAHFHEGDIVEVSPEEAQTISHHWEPLGDADPSMTAELAKRKTYDVYQPPAGRLGGRPIVKSPETVLQEAKDRKKEQEENDARRAAYKKSHPRESLGQETSFK